MNTKELFSKRVLDANANEIGKVADMDFNIEKGAINGIVVKAGLTKKYHIGLDKIGRIGDDIVLKISKDELGRKS
jgi:sporulation protein YlmC with PRC-barrel domain